MSKVLNVLLMCSISFCVLAQENKIKKEYDQYLHGTDIGSVESVSSLAESANSKYNIIISYFINSNNIMYKKTGEKNYLKFNKRVIDIIVKQTYRLAYFQEHEGNNELNHSESVLFEGYLNRYIAEYVYLIKKYGVVELEHSYVVEYLEQRFSFWRTISLSKTLDYSFLYGIRIHMGAQWATLALYLEKLTIIDDNKVVYQSFVEDFNVQIFNNLCFINDRVIWNSTYDNKFTNSLKKRNEKSEVQDTSHGNHVIEYFLVEKELGNERNIELLKKLSRTFLKNIVGEETIVSKCIDGSKKVNSVEYLILLSDGWMKLVIENSDIEKYWSNIHKKYKINKLNSYNQFLAVLYKNEN